MVNQKPIGFSGTNISGGYIDEDYLSEWNDLTRRCDLIQRMVDGLGSTSALLDAIKRPLLSAKYFIQENEEIDDRIIKFSNNQFFEYQKHGFTQMLSECLTFIEYGFSVFEKVPKIYENNLYYCYETRMQKSIERWEIAGKPWKDGHPAGITQILESTDESGDRFEAEIPWEKITLFSLDRVGNNFEGKSILRRVNIYFQMITMLYKISAIAEEKYGVGTPYAKHKVGLSESQKNKIEEMLSNIRSNEQGFALFDSMIEEFGILTPQGKQSEIMDLINHHDQKIYDSVLAGFLKLASGDGGSNALSKDQSSFFLKNLQYFNDIYMDIFNRDLKELVIFNFGEQENYPKLVSSDIGQVSLDEYVQSIGTAKEKGLVTWTNQDEIKIREQTKLPTIDDDMINEQKEENLKNAPKEILPVKKEDSKFSEKKNLFFATIKPRERSFMRNIGDYENYLESEYNNFLTLFEATEKNINNYLVSKYAKSDTKRIDGVLTLDSTPKNRKIQKEMISFVDSETKKLEEKVINSKMQDRLFNNAKKMAIKNLKENERFFADDKIEIDEGQFNSFKSGYISNVSAILFNDSRRVKEKIVLNFGSKVSVDLAAKQAGEQVFNRNVLKLSVVTHPRGAYNAIQYDENGKKGFVFYKIVVPKKKIKDLNPNGMTASVLFLILTAAEINRRASKETDGKNTDAVSGLNLHHNAFVYYYPISSEDLEEERIISEQQREELKNELEN